MVKAASSPWPAGSLTHTAPPATTSRYCTPPPSPFGLSASTGPTVVEPFGAQGHQVVVRALVVDGAVGPDGGTQPAQQQVRRGRRRRVEAVDADRVALRHRDEHGAARGREGDEVVVGAVGRVDRRHRPLPVLVPAGAVVGEHVGVGGHVEVGAVGGQRGDAGRHVLGDGGRAVAVDDPGDGGCRAGRVLRRGEHGAVGALRRRHPVGRERERDGRAQRQRPRGGEPGPVVGGVAVAVVVDAAVGGRRVAGRGRPASVSTRPSRRPPAAGQRAGSRGRQSQLQAPTGSPAHRRQYGVAAGGRYGAPMATTRDITYEADGRTMIGTLALPDGQRTAAPASWSATRARASTTTPGAGPCGSPTSSATWPSPSTTTAAASRSTDRDADDGAASASCAPTRRGRRAIGTAGPRHPARRAPHRPATAWPPSASASAARSPWSWPAAAPTSRPSVGFHSGLATVHPEDARNITGKVLALIGADDPIVHNDERRAFEEEMRAGGVDWELNVYGGAVHSFTNPRAAPVDLPGHRLPRAHATAGPGRPCSTSSTRCF